LYLYRSSTGSGNITEALILGESVDSGAGVVSGDWINFSHESDPRFAVDIEGIIYSKGSSILSKVATVANVDMKTAASTTLYTVPAGKTFYPDHVIIRDNSASLAGGSSYSFTNWRQAVDLQTMTATTGYRILLTTDNTTFTPIAAAGTFQITVTTGSTAVCTATIEVWGSLI